MDKGLGERMGVVCWEGCCVGWMPRGDSSISSSGDSRLGIAMEEWEYFMGGASGAGGSVRNAPAPMAGKVCRRGREAALARGGSRLCCEVISGLGPQLESGEKKGEVGLRRSGEKVVLTVVSE